MSSSTIGRDYWDAAIVMTPCAQAMHKLADITSPYESENAVQLTLFVSCCNEEQSIADTLATVIEAMEVTGKQFEILVIDDNSSDRSVEMVKGFMNHHPRVPILLRANRVNKGLAQNYVDGAFIGRGQYYRLVRGNNSEPVETMVDTLKAVGEADIVVPYFISMRPDTSFRKRLSRAYTWLLNFVTGNRINYYNGLHVHLRHNVMRWHSNAMGFGFQADLLCRLLELGFTCKQVPCRAVPRYTHRNVITARNLLSVAHTVIDIVIRRLSRRLHRS